MPEDTKEQNECFECKKKKDARWRQDFPVEWESDNYVTRREMVKFLALGSLTIAGANAVLAGIPHMVKAAELPRTRVALASSIPVGGFLFQQRKIPAFLSGRPTAIWLRIPRCALISHVPWYTMRKRTLCSVLAITVIFRSMKDVRTLVRPLGHCHGSSWNNREMKFSR